MGKQSLYMPSRLLHGAHCDLSLTGRTMNNTNPAPFEKLMIEPFSISRSVACTSLKAHDEPTSSVDRVHRAQLDLLLLITSSYMVRTLCGSL